MTSPLRPRIRRGYAVGGIASGTFGTVPGLLLMPYLTDVLAVGAAVAGLIVFVPKAWDMVLNPIAGRVSDRVSRPDRRRPFLLVAGPAMGLGFAVMFSGPTGSPAAGAAWVLALFLLCASAYAFFQVPYLALAAELTDDYDERTRMMTWRVVVITIAITIGGAGAPWLVSLAGGAAGYRLMGWTLGAVIASGAVAVWWLTRGATITRTEQAAGHLGEQLRIVLANREARPLVIACVLQAVATSMLLAGVAYAARYVIGDPESASLLFVAFVVPAVIVTPWWGRLAAARGKRRGFTIASLVLLLGLVLNVAARNGSLTAALTAGVIVGIGYAGIQLFPLSMLPDVAAHDAALTGHNRIGVYSGVWAGLELLGFALGPALVGVILALGGYRSGESVQPESVTWAIGAAVALVPAALVAVSVVAIGRYRLDDAVRTRPTSSSNRP